MLHAVYANTTGSCCIYTKHECDWCESGTSVIRCTKSCIQSGSCSQSNKSSATTMTGARSRSPTESRQNDFINGWITKDTVNSTVTSEQAFVRKQFSDKVRSYSAAVTTNLRREAGGGVLPDCNATYSIMFTEGATRRFVAWMNHHQFGRGSQLQSVILPQFYRVLVVVFPTLYRCQRILHCVCSKILSSSSLLFKLFVMSRTSTRTNSSIAMSFWTPTARGHVSLTRLCIQKNSRQLALEN